MNWVNYFNDGISDSGILLILVLVDTILAVSYQIKISGKITSNRLMSGLLRNITLAFTPSLVSVLSKYRPRTDGVYQILAAVLALFIGYAIIESILSYISLWGVKYPDWMMNWLRGEISSKEERTNGTDSKKD